MSVDRLFGVPKPLRAENKLSNAVLPKVTLLVEAGPDLRFWRMWTDSTACAVRIPSQPGRYAVVDELRNALDRGLPFLACIDADLDRVEGTCIPEDGLIRTDAHDLEVTLLCLNGLLQKVLDFAIGGAQQNADSLRDSLLEFCEFPGRLRWLALRSHPVARDLRLKKDPSKKGGEVQHFEEWDKLGAATLTLAIDAFLHRLCDWNSAQKQRNDLPRLRQAIDDLPAADLCQLVNGHDLIGALLAWMLATAKGAAIPAKSLPTDAAALSKDLAMACERPMLETTQMWAALRVWEARHPGYTVLKPT